MSIQEMQQQLAQYDGEWKASQENAKSGGAVLPAGDYQARIVLSRVERSDWEDLTFTLRFEDMNGAGIVTTYDNLDHEVGRSIGAERCKALGFTGLLSELPQACLDGFFDDLVCDIRVKDKPAKDDANKIYKVVYVNRVHGKEPGGDSKAAVDDDLPF